MCLAIYKPAHAVLQRHELENAFSNNYDGAGFAIAKDGKLRIYKGFFTFSHFWATWKKFEKEDAILHFRLATHGKEDKTNCHPFSLIGGKYALIHNGILPIDTSEDLSKSDTYHFAELVLAPMLESVEFDDPALKWLIENAIGNFNKLIVLRADGEHVIFNEDMGGWENGSWFSNTSHHYSIYGFGNSGRESYTHWSGCSIKGGENYAGWKRSETGTIKEMSDEEIRAVFPDWEPMEKTEAELKVDAWLEKKEAEHEEELKQRESQEKSAILEIQESEGEFD